MAVNERLSSEVMVDPARPLVQLQEVVPVAESIGVESGRVMTETLTDPILPGQGELLSTAPKKKTTTTPAGQLSDEEVRAILDQQAGRKPTDPKGKPILTGEAWQTVLSNEKRQKKKKEKKKEKKKGT